MLKIARSERPGSSAGCSNQRSCAIRSFPAAGPASILPRSSSSPSRIVTPSRNAGASKVTRLIGGSGTVRLTAPYTMA